MLTEEETQIVKNAFSPWRFLRILLISWFLVGFGIMLYDYYRGIPLYWVIVVMMLPGWGLTGYDLLRKGA